MYPELNLQNFAITNFQISTCFQNQSCRSPSPAQNEHHNHYFRAPQPSETISEARAWAQSTETITGRRRHPVVIDDRLAPRSPTLFRVFPSTRRKPPGSLPSLSGPSSPHWHAAGDTKTTRRTTQSPPCATVATASMQQPRTGAYRRAVRRWPHGRCRSYPRRRSYPPARHPPLAHPPVTAPHSPPIRETPRGLPNPPSTSWFTQSHLRQVLNEFEHGNASGELASAVQSLDEYAKDR